MLSFRELEPSRWTFKHCRDWIWNALNTGDVRPGVSTLSRDAFSRSEILQDARRALHSLHSDTFRHGVILAIRNWNRREHGYTCLKELSTLAWELSDSEACDALLEWYPELIKREQISSISLAERDASYNTRGYLIWRCAGYAMSAPHWQRKLIAFAQNYRNDERLQKLLRELQRPSGDAHVYTALVLDEVEKAVPTSPQGPRRLNS